ncbi:MAG: hypothetical protein FJY37_06110 [Betaproteobacteria bacterium]|nr:hypothetical protein [Betaproteobacteria bacterium]
MKMRALMLAGLLAVAGPVLAAHCPRDMKEIDDILATNPSLSAGDLATVKKLRAEGEALHKSGKHGESVDRLGEALKILKAK